jgi:hypothetical protein
MKNSPIKVDDLVIIPIKNRWGLDCAATVRTVYSSSFDATVWNMMGPGDDMFVTDIPFSEIIPNGPNQTINIESETIS